MKRLFISTILLAGLSATAWAQDTPRDTTESRGNRPLINEKTREDIREATQQVGQEVEKVSAQAESTLRREYERSADYIRENQLWWFQPRNWMAGGSFGLGLGENSRYINFNPRVGYFFQPGFMAGMRFDFDRRMSRSYRANQYGVFARYYPFRTRISGFGGVGYNFGREFASNIDDKSRYHAVTLEVGTMFLLSRQLGGEISLENNYYDRQNPLAGQSRGGRLKFGVNYYFGRAGR